MALLRHSMTNQATRRRLLLARVRRLFGRATLEDQVILLRPVFWWRAETFRQRSLSAAEMRSVDDYLREKYDEPDA